MSDDNDFPGVVPHKRTAATREVPQMVIRSMGKRIIIDVTYVDTATGEAQYRAWIRARESGALAQLIDSQSYRGADV